MYVMDYGLKSTSRGTFFKYLSRLFSHRKKLLSGGHPAILELTIFTFEPTKCMLSMMIVYIGSARRRFGLRTTAFKSTPVLSAVIGSECYAAAANVDKIRVTLRAQDSHLRPIEGLSVTVFADVLTRTARDCVIVVAIGTMYNPHTSQACKGTARSSQYNDKRSTVCDQSGNEFPSIALHNWCILLLQLNSSTCRLCDRTGLGLVLGTPNNGKDRCTRRCLSL